MQDALRGLHRSQHGAHCVCNVPDVLLWPDPVLEFISTRHNVNADGTFRHVDQICHACTMYPDEDRGIVVCLQATGERQVSQSAKLFAAHNTCQKQLQLACACWAILRSSSSYVLIRVWE